MARLSSEHKRLIVQRLATFHTATDIQRELQDRGVAVSLSQIAYYDPSSAGSDLAEEWRTLFDETRKAFITSTADIAGLQKSWRARELTRLYRLVASRQVPNIPLAAALLKQLAMEEGGMFTSPRALVDIDLESLADNQLAHLTAGGSLATLPPARRGVLAVPVPLSDDQWTATAAAQQAELTRLAHRSSPRDLPH